MSIPGCRARAWRWWGGVEAACDGWDHAASEAEGKEWIQDRGIGMPVDPKKWFALSRSGGSGASVTWRAPILLPEHTVVLGCDGCTNYVLRICDILSGA